MKREAALIIVLWWLLGVVIGMALMVGIASRPNCDARDTVRVVMRDTVRDTIRCVEPVMKDSVVVRYEKRLLAIAETSQPQNCEAQTQIVEASAAGQEGAAVIEVADSVAVEIPITQKMYETDEYKAWVSGYEPSLDSIYLYRETIQETITLRANHKSRTPRVGFGIVAGAGYGLVSKQPDVFIGGAVYFRIWP